MTTKYTVGVSPSSHDYDILETGEIVNFRPAGNVVDTSGRMCHPEEFLADRAVFMPAKEAADKLLAMMQRAGDRPASAPVSHPRAFEDEKRICSIAGWPWNPPTPSLGIALARGDETDDEGDVNKWHGRSYYTVPAADDPRLFPPNA